MPEPPVDRPADVVTVPGDLPTNDPCPDCGLYVCRAADVLNEKLEDLCQAAMLRRLQKAKGEIEALRACQKENVEINEALAKERDEARDGRRVYILGDGPLGTINCAVGLFPNNGGRVALVIHEVTREEAGPIGVVTPGFAGRSSDTLRRPTEIWFKRPESVTALVETLGDVMRALTSEGKGN